MLRNTRKPIAIIGMGCRFPGDADNPDAFWDLLTQGRDAICDVPPDRWNIERFYHPDPAEPGKMYTHQGGFLSRDIHACDPAFFGITPREAEHLDPQQKLLLEVAWEAIEDAGITSIDYSGANVGVYIGGFSLDSLVQQSQIYQRSAYSMHSAVSSTMTILSSRLSYAFDLRGPSFTVDTACSSSLVSLHLACQALWSDECDMALTGGVNIMFRPEQVLAMSKAHFLAPDGRCKTFDKSADGYARGEGAGILILKPLADAQADGDHIHALVRATGINQDGRTDGITVPNGNAQEHLIRQVCTQAGITPAQLHYIEAHGTGTQIGDITEANALGRVMADYRTEHDPVWVGSVKTNIGHLEAAAGVASVIKVLMSMKHRAIPPHLHLHEINPAIDMTAARLKVPFQMEDWPGTGAALASVNSFGYGGTNAHVILQALPQPEPPAALPVSVQSPATARPYLVPYTAHSSESLVAMIEQHAHYLGENSTLVLDHYAYTLTHKRNHWPYRLAVVTDSADTLRQQLITTTPDLDVVGGHALKHKAHKTLFVFTGMGAQWWGMGRELIETEPIFKQTLDECDAVFQQLAGWSLYDLFAQDDRQPMDEPQHAQPANFMLQVGLARLWTAYGLAPDGIVGHSVGEIAAAYCAGAIDLAAALRIIWRRSTLQQTIVHQGGMLAVALSFEAAQARIAPYGGRVVIAAINSPSSVTLAGDLGVLGDLEEQFQAEDLFARQLHVAVAYHSPQIEPLHAAFMDGIGDIVPYTPQFPLYSTVTGQRVDGGEHTADYWWQNNRQPVRLQTTLQAAITDGYDTFVEIGPHPVLSSAIQDVLRAADVTGISVPSLRRKEPEQKQLLRSLGQLYAWGQAIDWDQLYPTGQALTLPTYPWQRIKLWAETDDSVTDRLSHAHHPLLQTPVISPDPTWESELNDYWHPYINDHQIEGLTIVPGACFVESALALAAEDNEFPLALHDIQLIEMLNLTATSMLRTQRKAANHTFSIFSQRQDQWVLHSTGRILSNAPSPRAATLDIAELQARCKTVIEPDAFYRDLKHRGMQYGPQFQVIRSLIKQDGEVLARIELPDLSADADRRYWIHPALLDAGFQSCLATTESAQIYIPIGMHQMRLYTRVKGPVWCYARLITHRKTTAEADLVFADMDGNVVAEALGVQFMAQRKIAANVLENFVYQLEWQPVETDLTPAPSADGTWLIVGDQGELGAALCEQLQQHPVECRLVQPPDNAQSGAQFSAQLGSILEEISPLAGIIYLRGATDTGLQDGLIVLDMLRDLVRLDLPLLNRLAIVTCGAQPLDETSTALPPYQMILWGLGRTLLNEYPLFNPCLIDLDPHDPIEAIPHLIELLLSTDKETEIALRSGKRYSHRLARTPYYPPELQMVTQDAGCALNITRPGVLDSLEFQETQRQPPGPGEIEINIKVSALNFKDLMKAMNMLPASYLDRTYFSDYLGLEHTGIVVNVGPDVADFKIGDDVVAIERKGGFRTYSTLPTYLVERKPDGLAFEQATVFINFMTAYYALNHLGQIQPGEKVLIHSASGGIGLASVQIVQWLGAEVFATAGTLEKREFLRELGIKHVSESRSLKFVDDMRTWTDGQGFDVVLNSLSGEALKQSVDLLAPFGRFIEIGKRDILTNAEFEMGVFDRNLTFTSVDMDIVAIYQPDLIAYLLHRVYELFQDGILKPLPVTTFPAHDITAAFRHMSQAKHIGKIMIDMADESLQYRPQARPSDLIHPGRSYLITGGYSGLGLVTAHWLVKHGAKNLILFSRSGGASDEAQAALRDFDQQGVTTLCMRGDVTQRADVERLIAQIKTDMPPLAGVIHSAMVLDDVELSGLTPERFETVLAPKVFGAWHLHELTYALPLDFFVLFSSISSILGNPLQGNYVAANAFLDGLAHYRQAQGLPGLSLNWGRISQVGIVARSPRIEQHLSQQGIHGLQPDHVMQLLDYFLRTNPTQICAANIDWKRWAEATMVGSRRSLYENLTTPYMNGNSARNYALFSALQTADPAQQLVIVVNFLLEQIAKVTHIPLARLYGDMRLDELGMDSLMALELNNLIRLATGEEFSPMKLLQLPSIQQLGKQLLERILHAE